MTNAVRIEAHHVTRKGFVLGLVNGRLWIGVSFERGTWRPARLAEERDMKFFRKTA